MVEIWFALILLAGGGATGTAGPTEAECRMELAKIVAQAEAVASTGCVKLTVHELTGAKK